MSYEAEIIDQKDREHNSVLITVGLKDSETGELLDKMDVGLSNHQLEDGKLDKRLKRYGKKLRDRYEESSSKPSKDKSGTTVEL